AARLGYDPFFPWAKVTVVAHVRREGGVYRAEVTLVDEQGVSRGTRELSSQGDDCTPLVGALALGISLALDPLSLPGKPSAPEPPANAPEAPAEPGKPGAVSTPTPVPVLDSAATPPAQRLAAASMWKGWAGLGAIVRYGVTPGLAFGGIVRGRVER